MSFHAASTGLFVNSTLPAVSAEAHRRVRVSFKEGYMVVESSPSWLKKIAGQESPLVVEVPRNVCTRVDTTMRSRGSSRALPYVESFPSHWSRVVQALGAKVRIDSPLYYEVRSRWLAWSRLSPEQVTLLKAALRTLRSQTTRSRTKELYGLLQTAVVSMRGPRKEWVLRDLAKYPPLVQLEFCCRLQNEVRAWVPRGTNLRMYSGTEVVGVHEPGGIGARKGSWVLRADEAVEAALRSMNTCHLLCSPAVAGRLPPQGGTGWGEVPHTPWHALLASALTETGIGPPAPRSDYCLSTPRLINIRCLSKFLREAHPRDLLPLNWTLLSLRNGDMLPEEKALLEQDKALDWEYPLNGLLERGKEGMPARRTPKAEEEDSKVDYAWSQRWATTADLLAAALKYLQDGQALYNDYKGLCHVDGGKTLRMKDLSGHSLSRMVKDALYNHHIEGMLVDARIARELGSAGEDTPLWSPESLRLPEEVASLRVVGKRELACMGKAFSHCVGTRVDREGSLFFRKGDAVAEVCASRWKVTECRGPRNHATEDSKALRELLDSSLQPFRKGNEGPGSALYQGTTEGPCTITTKQRGVCVENHGVNLHSVVQVVLQRLVVTVEGSAGILGQTVESPSVCYLMTPATERYSGAVAVLPVVDESTSSKAVDVEEWEEGTDLFDTLQEEADLIERTSKVVHPTLYLELRDA